MSNLTTWMSAGALIISVAVPFFQYIMRMREEKDKFKKSWSAGFSDTSEDQQLGHFRVRMLYSTPEDPSLTLEMVKVVKPRDALLAMKDITANSFGRSEEVLALT